ncbi:SurA N-terminal domain-containing protein [Actinomadura meridiana]|uniref:SurA N-terminal domain-containing protein n=1 Tax=Actinomadura meridiana TaxID=559626 RepID=A0ABP8BSU7_9ACTN
MGAAVAATALAGCGGSPKVGTAALVDGDRITVTSLSQTVRDWRVQFRKDPRANDLRANPGNPAPQIAGDSDSDLRGALTLLINFDVADEVAHRAGVTVTGSEVDTALGVLNRRGGAESITLASGLPRDRTRDLARMFATQIAVMRKFGGDPADPLNPATQQAGQRWEELFRTTADRMNIEINPRYGTYDPDKVEVGPVRYRLSSPDSGTRGA